MILCLHAICPQNSGKKVAKLNKCNKCNKGMGHVHKDLGVVWLCYSQDSLQPFSRWITALRALRPSGKSKWSSFLRVNSHD